MTDEPKGKEPDSAVDKEEILFNWNSRIRMLFNPILWRSFFLVFGVSVLVLGVVLLIISGSLKPVALMTGGLFVFFAVIWAIVGIAIDLAGGFHASYLITSRGIYFKSGKTEKDVARAAVILGAMVGKPGMAGAGILAASEQGAFIGWDGVKKVSVSEGRRYIFIRKGFGSKPLGIYCTEENFGPVLQVIRSRCHSRSGMTTADA